MASAWCLVQKSANDFIKALQKGELDPIKMAEMSSEDRHALLAKYVGDDNATQVNALYESKLLLKDQQRGMISWIKRTANLNPAIKRDLVSRVEKLDKVLNPDESKQFYKDLASTRLGADVTPDQAKSILDLSNKIKETQALKQEDGTFPTDSQRLDYGRAVVALNNYVGELKANMNKVGLNPVEMAKALPGVSKSIRASMDNSAIFRQGWKVLMTHPTIWLKNSSKSFVNLAKEFGTGKVMDEVNADIISRPNYDRYVKAKLAVSTIEEAYPSALPEKIPVLGRAYKATETAFTAFQYQNRADVFDKYLQIADRSGLDINNPKELQSIGAMVNSLTGRGGLGKYEPAANLVNNVFFSPRYVKSQIDTLLHPITGAGGSNFVRKQAAVNLVKVIAGTATVLTVANALKPGSVETDPRSSDFGKVKVGDTRFDVSGGMGSLVTLAARLATMSSKSSTTGKVTPLNSGKFGAQTGWDVVTNFFDNKLSPAASVIKDITSGQDFNGNKITLGGELQNLFTPLSVSTFQELKSNPNSAPIVWSMLADALGINTNTYSPKPAKSTNPKPTKSAPLKQTGSAPRKSTRGGLKFK